MVCTMLLFGAVGSVLEGWTLFLITVKGVKTLAPIYWLGVAVALTYGMFCISHFMLAVRYRKMATNVPLLLDGKTEKLPTTCEKVIYWTLLTLNIAAPLLLAFSQVTFRIRVNYNGLPPYKWQSFSYNTALEIVGLLQIWSGFFLVRSVLKIRRFFIEHDAKDFINTSMLLRHATAFGLYITCTAAFFTVLSIYVWTAQSKWYSYTAATGIFFNLGSFISELLLFNIFWDLAAKIEKPSN